MGPDNHQPFNRAIGPEISLRALIRMVVEARIADSPEMFVFLQCLLTRFAHPQAKSIGRRLAHRKSRLFRCLMPGESLFHCFYNVETMPVAPKTSGTLAPCGSKGYSCPL